MILPCSSSDSGAESSAERGSARARDRAGDAGDLAMAEDSLLRAKADSHNLGWLVSELAIGLGFISFLHKTCFPSGPVYVSVPQDEQPPAEQPPRESSTGSRAVDRGDGNGMMFLRAAES